MLEFSKTFFDLPEAIPQGEKRTGTASYTIMCGGHKIFSARLKPEDALQAKVDFMHNAETISRIASEFPGVRFTRKPVWDVPEDFMPVMVEGDKCFLPVNITSWKPELLKHYNPNLIKWILAVDSNDDVELFDTDVRFSNRIIITKVNSKGFSNILVVNASRMNIWALTDGKSADIDSPAFSAALSKLFMLEGLV